jgi:phosphoribosylformylglycinamidine cyclo-ligase
MDPGQFDVAGFCVGVAEREELLDGSLARAGDVLIGLESSGLHANGYSLVRSLVARHGLDLGRPYREFLAERAPDATDAAREAEPETAGRTLGEVLLTPTRIYARDVLALRDELDAAGTPVAGLAHVTGGGLPGNVPRALPAGLAARVRPAAWPEPTIVRLVAALAGLDGRETRATLNAGIGMVVVIPEAAAGRALAVLGGRGIPAWPIGDVVPVAAAGGERYVETG